MQKQTRVVRIANIGYSYHPDFKMTKDGYKTLSTGKWAVEWSIAEYGKPVWDCYRAEFKTKESAQALCETLSEISNDFAKYRDIPANSEIFTSGKLVQHIDPRTKKNNKKI